MNDHQHLWEKVENYPLTAAWVAMSVWITVVVAILEAK